MVFDFPVSGPKTGSIERNDRNAIQQLEYWKMFKDAWCDHNPSVTIYVKEHEWLTVGGWVYQNWDSVGGLSFLPHDGGTYPLAPYEEIDDTEYDRLAKLFPKIDFNELTNYEHQDTTKGSQEFACSGGNCELR
jgi:ribonucleoside-diphosphate reductase alpha chain